MFIFPTFKTNKGTCILLSTVVGAIDEKKRRNDDHSTARIALTSLTSLPSGNPNVLTSLRTVISSKGEKEMPLTYQRHSHKHVEGDVLSQTS